MTKEIAASLAVIGIVVLTAITGYLIGYHNRIPPEMPITTTVLVPAEPCTIEVIVPTMPETVTVTQKLTPEEIINLIPRTVAWQELAIQKGAPYFGVTVGGEK